MEPFPNFIQTIGKLKESSKYAVVDGNEYSLDSLKEYLHVEREVERNLRQLIVNSSKESKAQLILVCGNVGDGKSHIISYLKKDLKDDIESFIIHNDATEAFNPSESFIDTLLNILDEFKDENIAQTSKKVILAINLGTLNNFLDLQQDNFKQLADYVSKMGILEADTIKDNLFNKESFFQYVNFTDFQLYSLTENGPVSHILSELLRKITSNKKENSIHKSFLEFKKAYEDKTHNPIVYNYEFLSEDQNREKVVQLVIKSIIKSKEIISLRSILNFIFDLLIPLDYQLESDEQFSTLLDQKSDEQYLRNIIPNYVFEHAELSKLFNKISKEDPCNIRSEQNDENIIRVINAENLSSFIRSKINDRLLNDNLLKILTRAGSHKKILSKSILRLYYFNQHQGHYELDESYKDFVQYLYYFNCNNSKKLKPLYKKVVDACKNWNGKPLKDDRIIIDIGVKQTKFRILVPFEVQGRPKRNLLIQKEKLDKFNPQIKLNFATSTSREIPLYLDYGLLKLLIKVTKGYRPNKLDKQSYISFINFLNKLIELDNQNFKLEIDEVNIGKNVDYVLSMDDTFGDEEDYKFVTD